jgi:hypothetical protein
MAHKLLVRDGDHLRAASAQEVLDRAAALMAQRFRAGALVLGSPDRTRQYLRHQIGTLTVRSLRGGAPQHPASPQFGSRERFPADFMFQLTVRKAAAL